MPTFFSNTLNSMGVPMWKASASVKDGTGLFGTFFTSREKLFEKNRILEEEIREKDLQLLSYNALRNENEQLKALLGRTSPRSTVLAAVLTKPTQTPYDTLIIDIGGEHGVSEGDKVFFGDVVIGNIDEVFPTSSRVLLFSAPGVETTVSIGGENITATAIGKGAGNFEVKLPRGVDIAVGDAVILPSISTELFALVEHIEVRPADSFQKILFKNPVNFFSLRFVEVLTTAEAL